VLVVHPDVVARPSLGWKDVVAEGRVGAGHASFQQHSRRVEQAVWKSNRLSTRLADDVLEVVMET